MAPNPPPPGCQPTTGAALAATAGAGMTAAATPSRVLSLYRALLREARLMPTANRRQFIEERAGREFRAGGSASDPQQIAFLISLAEVQVDNAAAQRQLLQQLHQQGNLKGPRS